MGVVLLGVPGIKLRNAKEIQSNGIFWANFAFLGIGMHG
jgi:hypothetical protein